jgi:FimV-like protein
VIAESDQSSSGDIPTHTVIVGDTLWSVAKRLRPDNMPMAQAMDSLYQYNPEAFLEGDSTKLIEGSVVSFPPATLVEEAPQFISQENSALVIPKIEVVAETNTIIELSSEKSLEIESQTVKEITQDVVDNATDENQISEPEGIEYSVVVEQQVPLVIDSDNVIQLQLPNENIQVEKLDSSSEVDLAIDFEVKDKPSQPELLQDPPESQSSIIQPAAKTPFIEQLKVLIAEFDKKDFSQLLSKAKQLPIDFWVFAGALLFAMVISRSRKLHKANKVKEDPIEKTEKPIETVLDGPFAESTDDDVFADIVEKPTAQKPQSTDTELEPKEAINLPGVEELEAQLREDASGEQPQTSKFLEVDFEDDTLDIDPLQIKLDMASLCIEMGDIESAQAILEEIIGEADKQGKAKAREILDSIET